MFLYMHIYIYTCIYNRDPNLPTPASRLDALRDALRWKPSRHLRDRHGGRPRWRAAGGVYLHRFRVSRFWCRVLSFWFRVSGFGFRVSGSGFRGPSIQARDRHGGRPLWRAAGRVYLHRSKLPKCHHHGNPPESTRQ